MSEEISKRIVVVRVVDEFTLVINKGARDGISVGDKFIIYYVDPNEIKDPVTGESLGNLEIVRGTGTVEHVQEKMCTLKSNRYEAGRRIIRRATGGIASLLGETVETTPERQIIPFDEPEPGDYAKQI